MAKLLDKMSAIALFYFMMSVDGMVTDTEKEKMIEVGNNLFDDFNLEGEFFKRCDELMAEKNFPSDGIDVLFENIDYLLGLKTTEEQSGIAPRLLIFDLLSIAYSDLDCSEDEREYIKHIAAYLEEDPLVVREMEQIIKTSNIVAMELDELKNSSKPYVEIRPYVDEAEKRQQVLLESAKTLILDEETEVETEKKKSKNEKMEKFIADINAATSKAGEATASIADGAKKFLGDKVVPTAAVLGEKAQKSLSKAGKSLSEVAVPAASGLVESTGKLYEKIKNAGNKTLIVMPEEYDVLKEKLPKDLNGMPVPKDSKLYGFNNGAAKAILIVMRVDEDRAIPFDNKQAVIKSVHDENAEDEALIEVDSGTTAHNNQYVYILRKKRTRMEGEEDMFLPGIDYLLNMNLKLEDKVIFVSGDFQEVGMIGARDALGVNIFMQAHDLKSFDELSDNGFWQDPYDPMLKKDYLMNDTERAEWDEMFPDHPLSKLREMTRFIIENN